MPPHPIVFWTIFGSLFSAFFTIWLYQDWHQAYVVLFGNLTIATVVTALLTVFFLGYRAIVGHQTLISTQAALEHSRRAEVATRYQKGMEMLANGEESTRIGGLYLLRDVVVALPDVYWVSVTDSLIPFIRQRCSSLTDNFKSLRAKAKNDEEPPLEESRLTQTPSDVVVALRILGGAWPELRAVTEKIPLTDRVIRHLVLSNVRIRDLSFDGVIFDECVFQQAKLENCKFTKCEINASVSTSRMLECDLEGATIDLAGFPFGTSDISFAHCNLRFAKIEQGQLTEVTIDECFDEGLITRPTINSAKPSRRRTRKDKSPVKLADVAKSA